MKSLILVKTILLILVVGLLLGILSEMGEAINVEIDPTIDNNSGAYSIALDSADIIHVSYWNRTQSNLVYCNNTANTWGCIELDTGLSVGQYNAIALDSDNIPHISYYDVTNTDLKYCNSTAGSWSCNTINDSKGAANSIAIDTNNIAHISFAPSDLRYCNNTAGSWSCETIGNETNAQYTSLAIDSNNIIHISYRDNANTNLEYCNNTADTWKCETIESNGGFSSSVAIDSNDVVHISHYDIDSSIDVRYCNNTANTWSCEKIDDLGTYTSIFLDSFDIPHLITWNGGDQKIEYYNHTGNSWGKKNLTAPIGPTIASNYMEHWATIKRGRLVDSTNFSGSIHFVYHNSTKGGLWYSSYALGNPIPLFFNNVAKSTNYRYENTTMNITIKDDVYVDGYYFSWNHSGSWINDSWVDVNNDIKASINISKNITLAPGKTIAWKYYANDSINATGGSSIYTFIVTNRAPTITLNQPLSGSSWYNIDTIKFNFTVTDSDNYGFTNCSLYGNFTGTWKVNQTMLPYIPRKIFQVSSYKNSTSLNGIRWTDISGDYAYVASASSDSLTIINITDPTNLDQISSFTNSTSLDTTTFVAVSGNYAYLSSWNSDSLTIINITDPTNLDQISSFTNSTSLNATYQVAISGNYAYITSYYSDSLTIINITDPKNPDQISSFTNSTSMHWTNAIVLSKNYAYVTAVDPGSLTIINVTDIKNPDQISSFINLTSLNDATGVVLSGNYAYVISASRSSVVTFNITDKSNIDQISSLEIMDPALITGGPKGMAILGDYIYVVSSDMYNNPIAESLTVINITDRKNPSELLNLTNGTSLNGSRSVTISGDYAYVAAEQADSLTIIDLNFSIKKDRISNFPNPLILPTGNYVWNVQCYDNATIPIKGFGSNNFSLHINDIFIFSNAKNTTTNYRYLNSTMNLTISNGTNIDGYIFSWNITGSFVNESWVDVNDDVKASINVSRLISLDYDKTIAWKYHANDTSDNWAGSSVYIIQTVGNLATFLNFNFTVKSRNYWTPQYNVSKSFWLNLTTEDQDISWARMSVKYPGGQVNRSRGKIRLDKNYSLENFIYEFNKTLFNFNGTYNINYSWSTFGGNITNKTLSFKTNYTLSYLPTTAYYLSPITYVNEILSSSVTLWSNSNESMRIHNLTLNFRQQNHSWFKITLWNKVRNFNDSKSLSEKLNSTTSMIIPFTIKAYNDTIPDYSYIFNLSINMSLDHGQYFERVLSGTVGIDPPAGNVSVYDSTGVTHCNSSTNNACYAALNYVHYGGVVSKTWRIKNTGSYTLSNCQIGLSDGYPGTGVTLTPVVGFNINAGGYQDVTLKIDNAVSLTGSWTNNYLQVNCSATGSGYLDDNSGNMPKVDITITERSSGTPVSGGAAGGGGAGAPAPPTIPTITEPARVWGDGKCDPGEDPNSPDCKIPFNFDTLVTCIYDPDIPCIYGESWFIQLLIYFIVGIGLYTIRGKPKKKRSFGSFIMEEGDEE